MSITNNWRTLNKVRTGVTQIEKKISAEIYLKHPVHTFVATKSKPRNTNSSKINISTPSITFGENARIRIRLKNYKNIDSAR